MSKINALREVFFMENSKNELEGIEDQQATKIKKLECLYRITTDIINRKLTIEDFIKDVLQVIPSGFQYPELISLRITWDKNTYKTEKYHETPWKKMVKTDIGQDELKIEVFYDENRPFSPEEDSLLKEITDRLKLLIEYQLSLKKLQKTLETSEKHEREVNSLLMATKLVLQYKDFNEAARAIFDSCKKLSGATSGYVALLSEDGAENELLFLDAGGLPCTVDPSLPMPIRGLRAEAYSKGKAVHDNDFMNSTWKKFMPKGHVILNNVLFAPLKLEGKTFGIMGLANKEGGFNSQDLELASAFSELAAISLHNSKMLESLKQSEKACQIAYDRTELYKDIFMHDINNVLQNINSAVELLKSFSKNVKSDTRITELYEIVDEQINRGAKLVSNVRKLSKVEEQQQKLYTIDLTAILNNAIKYVKKTYSEQDILIKINKEIKNDNIRANEFLLDVFENILINAIIYNESSQKEIIITMKKRKEANNSWLEIEFCDNGIGIPDSMKQQLFQGEISKKSYSKGMGMGLITVKKILNVFNGKIWVENRFPDDYQKGSKFVILLPEDV